MKTDDVPQETARTYGGERKLLYAVDEKGNYQGVNSAGWDVETYATVSAVEELVRLRNDAFERAKAGRTSPLEYHMYRARMDPPILASATGVWQWQLKRHLRASVFSKLSDHTLSRYADAMGISIAQLKALPENPDG